MKKQPKTAKDWLKYYAEQCIKRNLGPEEKAKLLELILDNAMHNAREEGFQKGRTLYEWHPTEHHVLPSETPN